MSSNNDTDQNKIVEMLKIGYSLRTINLFVIIMNLIYFLGMIWYTYCNMIHAYVVDDGKNFYDFVNHYRVQEAKEQLGNPALSQKTIQRVFEDVGFNSKSTFNTIFKKVTGQTPSEYRRSQKRGDLDCAA